MNGETIFSAGPEYLPRIEKEIRELGQDPDAVRRMLEAGTGVLMVAPDGFLVCSSEIDAGEPVMFVWLAWCSGREAMARYWPLVRRMAEMVGARRVRCQSHRRGYLRLGWREVGFDDDGSYFEKEIHHDWRR